MKRQESSPTVVIKLPIADAAEPTMVVAAASGVTEYTVFIRCVGCGGLVKNGSAA
jgi:hypothetical protein